jgi:hypothetical protein
MRGGAALETGNCNAPVQRIRPRPVKVALGNDSCAGGLDSPVLGGVERKEQPSGKQAPSIGSSAKRPQLPPRWGRFVADRHLSSSR